MRRLGLGASVALIVAATLSPFSAALTIPFAARWCLTCTDRWLSDAISNVVLFVPLGLALTSVGTRSRTTLLWGAGLSFVVELLQSMGIPQGRSPSVLDLLTNTTGALIGVALVGSLNSVTVFL